ncbi:MAG TPA: hypothetical protein P5230_03345 [Candidatus Magasanikbacteria bacterium]|nr:hypothetical protein [Candidatus Magasanikbacteria bacterium]
MDSANDNLAEKLKATEKLLKRVNSIKSKQLGSTSVKDEIKAFVKAYFEILQSDLKNRNISTGDLDIAMQNLITLANTKALTSKYKTLLKKVKMELVIVESSGTYTSRNRDAGVLSNGYEQAILKILNQIVPAIGNSYQQVLNDLNSPRISYRGTVAEIREVLRETLDYLAPDEDVKNMKDFKLEKDMTKPTMKQKVRYVLSNRGKSETATKSPEDAAHIVDDGVERLVRSTYNRGSLSTHTTTSDRAEACQIKMYLDTVLCELLEIHSKN